MRKSDIIKYVCVFSVFVFCPYLFGVEYHISGSKPFTHNLPGGWAALVDPISGELYRSTDPIVEGYAFSVVYDTGASGVLLSSWVKSLLEVPTVPGETYDDQGIGGIETFDVSVPTRLLLADITIPADTVEDDINNFSAYGEFKFQVRRPENESAVFNIIGTPVLHNYVMQVIPNSVPFSDLTVSYMEAHLLSSVSSAEVSGAYCVDIEYRDFVGKTVPVSVDYNPVIPAVQIVDSRKDVNEQSSARDWLLDTGATLTIIGRDYAEEVGIDLDNESPAKTVQVMGVGGQIREFYGYVVDQIVVPLDSGDELIFDDVMVFVPEEGALPADLPGILGMNLLGRSYSEYDPYTGIILDESDSPFESWYVDSVNQKLYLIVPLPSSALLFLIGVVSLLIRRWKWMNG